MISIVAVETKTQLKEFVKFPFEIYKNSNYWVPPLIQDELNNFNPKNEIFKTVDKYLFLAYKNEKVVGRIAVIINWTEVNVLKKSKVRFGWFETIDDIEVTKKLLEQAHIIAKKHHLEIIEGPMGFSNMDKAGMLTKGFDEVATMIGLYNPPYYVEHLTALGFNTEAHWVEHKFDLSHIKNEKFKSLSEIISKRNNVQIRSFETTKELLPYADEMFQVLNHAYSGLQSFVPLEQFQIDHYKEKYIKFLNPNFICMVQNAENKIIGFAITIPSMSAAFQKANGKLFPFGFWHLLQSGKKNTHVEFYLIGIEPEYQNKGIPVLIFNHFYDVFKKFGIKTVETNPQLEENNKIQQLWRNFSPVTHKERSTFSLKVQP